MNTGDHISEYLYVLWRRRRMIAAVTLTAVLAAGLVGLLIPPVYEAKALLLVTKPAVQVGAPPDPGPGLKVGAVLAAELPTETVVAFANSAAIVEKIAVKVLGQGRHDGEFAKRLVAQPVRNTSLVELRVKRRDPTVAARIANEWATTVLAESEALFATTAGQSYTFFSSRLDAARGELERAEAAVREFQAKSRLEVLEARAKSLIDQIATYQSRMTDLDVTLKRSESELAQTEAQIRRQPKTLVLSKSITTDPVLHGAVAGGGSRREFLELSKLNLKTEELNPVYTGLDNTRVNSAVRVAALSAERARVAEALARMGEEVTGVLGEVAARRYVQTRLLRATDAARQVHLVLLQRREESRLAADARTGLVKLAAEAVVPYEPVGPRKLLNIVLGAVLGIVAGGLLAFALETYGVVAGSLVRSGRSAAARSEAAKEASTRSPSVPTLSDEPDKPWAGSHPSGHSESGRWR